MQAPSGAKWLKGRENLQPVPSAGKYTTVANCEKRTHCHQARENMQLGPSAGKPAATGTKRGKTCNWDPAWKNMPAASGAKRGKTYKNQAVRSAGKHESGARESAGNLGKTHVLSLPVILLALGLNRIWTLPHVLLPIDLCYFILFYYSFRHGREVRP